MPQQPYDTPVPDGGVKPFRVALPESLLADLRERLDRTRWPDEIPGSGWSYGTSLSYARELAAYWKDEYDWRAQEAKLNAFEQYSAPLKGIICTSSTSGETATIPYRSCSSTAGQARCGSSTRSFTCLRTPVSAAASASLSRRCPATDSRFGPSKTDSASSTARMPSRS